MNIEEAIKYIKNDIECDKDTRDWFEDKNNPTRKQIEECIDAYETLLTAYEKEKEKNKNKDKILRNIRDEFLKYNWKDANPIQTYNQIKSLYESIYCKPYED